MSQQKDQQHTRKRKILDHLQTVQLLNEESDDELVDDDDFLDPDYEDSGPEPASDSSSDSSDEEDNIPLAQLARNIRAQNIPVSKNTQTQKDKPRKIIWYAEKENNHCQSIPVFTGAHKVKISGETPLDYFLQLIPEKLLSDIVYQSNLYAVQSGKENFRLTIGELKVFFGICFVMTYVRYARIRQYWSSEHGLRLGIIADHMSVNRFEEIRRYLHLNDNSTVPDGNKDRLIKLRPFLDTIHTSFHEAVDPEEYQSVDEMMIPFKGRSSIKQYLPKKPKKWGFKAWVRAGGASGYVYCIEIYQGAGGDQDRPKTTLGAVGDMVVRLCHDIHGKNHKLFCDNLFTTSQLALTLKGYSILYLGTCRANRIQEAAKKLKSAKHLQDLGRGSSTQATSSDNVTIVRWLDNSLVHTLSTYVGVKPEGTAKRYCRKEKKIIEIKRPYAIEIYNKHMGGVDLMDSLVALYRNDVRNKRWYMRIFYHLLNVAVANAWIIWRWKKHEEMDLLEFKSRVATGLIFTGEVQTGGRKRGRPSAEEHQRPVRKMRPCFKVPLEKRFDGGPHYPKKTEGKNACRCREEACRRKTRYLCQRCAVPLCPECFLRFHTK